MTEYAVVDPRTNAVLREYPTDTDERVSAAVAAAQSAFQEWGRASSVSERAALLQRVSDLHLDRADDLAQIISREMGKSIEGALGEVQFSAGIYGYYAERAEEFLAEESIELLYGEGQAVVQRRPVGVLLGIMPWNYPYYQVARFAAPNLAAGNTILLKHAPQCPESAAAIQAIFDDAGFPEGAYVNVYASHEQIERIVGDPRVQGVSLTGSERAGSAVAEIAGRHLKKVVLELGGSDPFILLGSEDLDSDVEAAVSARLDNGGQACNAGKRFIVHESIYDEFLQRFTQEMLANPSQVLSSVTAAERLEEQVAVAVEGGASLETRGSREGAQFPPGVLTGISRDNAAYSEELFGPVAMVFKVADEDEAITLANDTPFGLGSYVFTPDPSQAARVAAQLDAGMVFVNGVGAEGLELPFGGVKRSGFGRELGRFGIDEFVNKKLIRTVR